MYLLLPRFTVARMMFQPRKFTLVSSEPSTLYYTVILSSDLYMAVLLLFPYHYSIVYPYWIVV